MVTEVPAAETPAYVSRNEFITVTPEEAIARIRKAKSVNAFVNIGIAERTLLAVTKHEAIWSLRWLTAARREQHGVTPVHITVRLMICHDDGMVCLGAGI